MWQSPMSPYDHDEGELSDHITCEDLPCWLDTTEMWTIQIKRGQVMPSEYMWKALRMNSIVWWCYKRGT